MFVFTDKELLVTGIHSATEATILPGIGAANHLQETDDHRP
jgi:hypothetical protein